MVDFSPATVLSGATQRSIDALKTTDSLCDDFAHACDLLLVALRDGKKILACGNGGSATDAAHFMTELLCRYKDDRPSLPGLALTNDGSFLSALANDYGYDQAFSRQVEGLGNAGDVLVGISTSGNSESVNRALRTARDKGLATIALLGRDGGAAAGISDVDLVVPCEETARIQEVHGLLIHAFCEFIDATLFNK